MYRMTITLSGGKLPRLSSEQIDATTLAAAQGAAVCVRDNFVRLARASRSRDYWHTAATLTQVDEHMQNSTCAISINQRGVRLHWQGGVVHPTGQPSEVTGKPTRSLLIPFEDSPLRLRRCSLAALGIPREHIHVITSRRGCPILVASEQLKRKSKLTYLGKLVKSATFRPRPDVLPSDAAMSAAARHGARQYLKTLIPPTLNE